MIYCTNFNFLRRMLILGIVDKSQHPKKVKAYFSMKPAKKNFSLLGGKIKFELALQPSTASTAKIQIQFSRQGD